MKKWYFRDKIIFISGGIASESIKHNIVEPGRMLLTTAALLVS